MSASKLRQSQHGILGPDDLVLEIELLETLGGALLSASVVYEGGGYTWTSHRPPSAAVRGMMIRMRPGGSVPAFRKDHRTSLTGYR
jgi:hypothetical protein